jgi:hypothetical protein
MKQLLMLLALTSLLLAACGGASTPDIEATVQAAIAATQAASDTGATLIPAVQPTEMPAPQPTNSPMPPPMPPTGAPTPEPPTSAPVSASTGTPTSVTRVAGCDVFPANNIWNTPVDTSPVDSNSGAYIATIGDEEPLHPDFGSGTWEGSPIGIPYVDVPGTQPKVPVMFDYDDESDPGPYPIPPDAPIEGGPDSDGDRHVLVVDRDNCILYELFYAWPQPDGSWEAGSGAIFDLKANALRPASWTSADAAGLPILPGLVRYNEVAEGEIRHALRFTAPLTRREYIWPARHYASSLTEMQYPPMGQRFRLQASFDISGFSPEAQVILRALKKYGMILADNGSPWFLSGVPDERWDNDVLDELRQVQGSDFEAVDVSSLMVDPDSGQAQSAAMPTAVPPGALATKPASIPAAASDEGGHLTYSLSNGRVYRIAAQQGATQEDVSLSLDGLASGSEDGLLNISPNGAWLVLTTDRFDPECVGWSCLVIVPGDLSAGEVIRAGGQVVHPEGFSAVASDGNLIVYPGGDGPHGLDLWAVTRSGTGWSAPLLLTGDSPYAYNDLPAVSTDGSSVVFDCGDEPYGAQGTAICEVASDGTRFRVLLTPAGSPAGFPDTGALHHPDYAPDGSIVFESDWDGEQIWRLPAGAAEPIRITAEFGNDNSPCVLPDGRIASLWLDRPGGAGEHEIKVMSADGSSDIMLLADVDVFDVGLGCGE